MNCIIHITGQISGNFKLARAIGGETSKGMFNSFICKFKTKTQAYKALAEAYKQLKSDEPEFLGKHLYAPKSHLKYDASIAEVIKERYA